MPYWLVIKYKPKDGCDDGFLKQAECPEKQIGMTTPVGLAKDNQQPSLNFYVNPPKL